MTEVQPLTFTITPAGRVRIKDWLATGHRCVPDSFNGLLTYRFTPCGIGDTVKVTCPCEMELDLTDIDLW